MRLALQMVFACGDAMVQRLWHRMHYATRQNKHTLPKEAMHLHNGGHQDSDILSDCCLDPDIF
jgi:hypothetical protein